MDNFDMETLLPPVLSFIAVILGLVVGFFTIRKKIRTELMAEFKKELRTERLHAYKAIWKKLHPVALYAPPQDLTADALSEMGSELSKCYFDHGIFLSGDCLDYYFVLQDAIQLLLRTDNGEEYVLRAQAKRLTLEELQREEARLGLKNDPQPTPMDLRKDVLPRIGKDPDNDYYFLRYLSSKLRTSLTKNMETRVSQPRVYLLPRVTPISRSE